jgi:hypothetical protein
LIKPILDLFQELKDRLERIPNDAQRMRANPELAKARKAAEAKENRAGVTKEEPDASTSGLPDSTSDAPSVSPSPEPVAAPG